MADAGGTGNDWSRAIGLPDDPGTLAAYRTPEFEVVVDGRLAADPAFRVVRCRSAPIRSEPPCGVELDGQLFGTTPVSVTVQPGALRALDCRESAE